MLGLVEVSRSFAGSVPLRGTASYAQALQQLSDQ
jgi:hypothetical protein